MKNASRLSSVIFPAIAILATVLIPGTGSRALASEPAPLLVKQGFSGFVAPAMRLRLTCRVFQDRIELTRGVGGIVSTRVMPQTLQGDVRGAIEEAKAGTLTNGHLIPDLGGTVYTATAADGSQVTLKAVGGHEISNDSVAAATLSALLDQLCN